MVHAVSIVVAGLCVFALAALLLPEGFAMPDDDDGNL
jgi:hypothetical protein